MSPRSTLARIAAALSVAVASASCHHPPPEIPVRVVRDGATELAVRASFDLLAPPRRRADVAPLGVNDPMLENSVTNRAVREELVAALRGRGYGPSTDRPDFHVAYYVGTARSLNPRYWAPAVTYSRWNSGTSAWPFYGGDSVPAAMTPDRAATVFVDAVDPARLQLIWRGEATLAVPDDPNDYAPALRRTIAAIVGRMPMSTRSLAGR